MRVDSRDRAILFELDLSEARSARDVAKRVGLSEDAVSYRLRRLQQAGVLRGFYTLINVSRLGYRAFRVYLKLEDISPRKEGQLVSSLARRPNFWWVCTLEGGPWDLGVQVWARNADEFRALWEGAFRKYKRFVDEENLSIQTGIVHLRRSYLKGVDRRKKDSVSLEIGEPVSLDSFDWRLLRATAAHARMPLVQLAEKMGVTPMAVKYRLDKLGKAGVIEGVRPVLDLAKLGYRFYKVNFFLRDLSVIPEMRKWAEANPNVTHVYDYAGYSDIEFSFELESDERLHELVNEVREKFSGKIKNAHSWRISEERKIVYVPEA